MSFEIARAVRFEKNLGENSQKNRFLFGGVFVFLAIYTGSTILFLVSVYLLASAFSNWCPVFSGLGKNTTESESKLYFDIFRMVKIENNLGMKSKKNRYIIGGVLLLLTFLTNWLILFPLSLLMLGSAYLGWCPVLSGLGKNTCDT